MKVRDRISEGFTRARLRLELRRARRPFAVTVATTIAGVAVMSFVLAQLGVPVPLSDTTRSYTVVVDDASGVVPGQHEVRVAGVDAGRITDARLEDGRAELDITIDSDYAPIHRDARVRLRPFTQLQDMHVDIVSRGTPGAGELAEGETLALEQTRTAVHVSRVLDTFDPLTRTRLRQMINEFARGLADDGHRLRAAFVELAPFLESAASLTRESAQRERITRRLVHNGRVLFAELARRERELTGLVARGGDTVAELGGRKDQIERLLLELPPTMTSLDRSLSALAGALDSVDPALEALRDPVSELDGGLRALTDLSADARPALEALRPAVRELAPVARRVPPLARELADSFDLLEPQGPALDRLTADVAGCEFPLQKFFHNTMSVFKFGHAFGAYPRGETAQGLGVLGGEDPSLIRGESCARRPGE